MTMVVRILPERWLGPLSSGDDSNLDPADRVRLAAFRHAIVSAHGDWKIAWARKHGPCSESDAIASGAKPIGDVVVTFITTPLDLTSKAR